MKGDARGVANFINRGMREGKFPYIGRNKIWTKEKIKKIDESYSGDSSFSFVAIDSDTDKIVGCVSFSFTKEGRTRHRVGFGWQIDSDYQGRGIATRLLKFSLGFAKDKGFKKAGAEVAVKNLSSINLAKRCGFKVEGVIKRGLILDDGKFVDTYVFGRLL